MRWSFEELVKSMRIYKTRNLKQFPYFIFKKVSVFFHWLFKGYCKETQYNLDEYLLVVLKYRLQKFNELNNQSFPGSFNTIDNWHSAVQNAINKADYLIDNLYSREDEEAFLLAYRSLMEFLIKHVLELWI